MQITFDMDNESFLGWKVQKSTAKKTATDEEIIAEMKGKIERIGLDWRVQDLRRKEKEHEVQEFSTVSEEITHRKALIVAAGHDPDELPALKVVPEEKPE